MSSDLATLPYRSVVAVDFEFKADPGERPDPHCLVARELLSGRTWRLWRSDMGAQPPYPTGPDTLFVAFYASAELTCHRVLGWGMPARILDLFAEFRCATNGVPVPAGNGLLGALTYYGLDGIGAVEKEEMRALAMRGGPWIETEKHNLVDYCAGDVDALARLLPRMLAAGDIDLPRALLRGRYMAAAAGIEHNGVPIDTRMLARLRHHWAGLQDRLIGEVDSRFGVFDGRTFKTDRFAAYLAQKGIPWPRLDSDRLDLSDDTFGDMAKRYPALQPLRQLRKSLAELRLNDLAVGHDGRNRTISSAFRARSGRNQPSNSRFIFGPSVWLRGLIRPGRGQAIAYIDFEQQEFGIAAALSGDPNMIAAYRSGDPYMEFAIQAGAAVIGATKRTHGAVRELYKVCALAVLYGMEADSLAYRLGAPRIEAAALLRAHREVYREFWRWSDAALDRALLTGKISTFFGWSLRVGSEPNPRSLRNFPMQANGAEMLRIACCLGIERGIEICAPVHDAVLIAAPVNRIEEAADTMQEAMAEASRAVLGGFEIRADRKIVKYPARYRDARGGEMWRTINKILNEVGE